MNRDTEVNREPYSVEEAVEEINDVFTFNPPQSQENKTKCEAIQNMCKTLAQVIANTVPQGKEQTIAINSLLTCALYANHGILRRQVVLVAVSPTQEEASTASPPASAT